MQLTATHYISLAVTLLVTLLPGLLAARRVKSADDYNVGAAARAQALSRARLSARLSVALLPLVRRSLALSWG